MPLFLIFIIFNNHSHSTIIHSFILHHSPRPVFLLSEEAMRIQEDRPRELALIAIYLACLVAQLNSYGRSWKWVTILPILVGIQLETVRGCASLKKYNFHGKDVDVILNSKEENSRDFCLDFVQEFGLWKKCTLWPLTCLALPSGSCISRRPRSWQHLAARLPTYIKKNYQMSKFLQSKRDFAMFSWCHHKQRRTGKMLINKFN
jgi:hypothetical protein